MPSPSLKIDHARYIVTLDPQRRIIRDGAILVEDGRIRRVGRAAELGDARADRILDARHLLVTPGASPTEYLASLGVLGPRVVLAHVLGLDDAEMDCLGTRASCLSLFP
jgi:cytosine/adenosine deaminase-related metal-dependent hydrolase